MNAIRVFGLILGVFIVGVGLYQENILMAAPLYLMSFVVAVSLGRHKSRKEMIKEIFYLSKTPKENQDG